MSVVIRCIIIGFLVSGCVLTASESPHPRPSLDPLPEEIAGVELDHVRVVDDSFLAGHPVDDVLAALGRDRSDATAIFRDSRAGRGGVGAVTVDGVDGAALLDAVVNEWKKEATIGRSQDTIGDRSVWVLRTRLGLVTIAYRRDSVVYVASSHDPGLAEQFVQALP